MSLFDAFLASRLKTLDPEKWDGFVRALAAEIASLQERAGVQDRAADAIVARGLLLIDDYIAPAIADAEAKAAQAGAAKTQAEALRDAIAEILAGIGESPLSAALVDETSDRKFVTTTTRGEIRDAALSAVRGDVDPAYDTLAEIVTLIATKATPADIDAAITALKGGVGSALDTLKELADAISDDANYAATVATSLGNRVRIDAAGNYSSAQMQQTRANILAPSVEAAAALGLVFDPFLEVKQENGTTLMTPAVATACYAADAAYAVNGTVAATFAMSVQNVVNPASGIADYKRLQASTKVIVTTQKASLGSAEVVVPCRLAIEGVDFDNLGWGTDAARDIDVLAIVVNAFTGVQTAAARNAVSSRSYVHAFNVAANTITPVLFTVPGDQAGSWANGAAAALQLEFGSVAGSTYQAPSLDGWLAGAYISHASATGWQASNGNYVQVLYCNVFPKGVLPWTSASQITGEALHRLLSMRRSYDDRLRKAQRYWWCSNSGAPKGNQVGCISGVACAQPYLSNMVNFPVQMRTSSPSVSYWNAGVQNQMRNSTTGAVLSVTSPGAVGLSTNGFCLTAAQSGSPFSVGGAYDFDVIANNRM